MEKDFDFINWTDQQLKERGQHLGQHILLAAEGTVRYEQMNREINHLIFELSARAIAATPMSVV